MTLTISPLAPLSFPSIPKIDGVQLAVGASGVRYAGRPDLLLVELAAGTTVGGVFTQSHVPGHPIPWSRRVASMGMARGLVVNAGNANVLNGAAGEAAVRATATAAAALLGCSAEAIAIASTGVIGEPLPAAKITDHLPALHRALAPLAWRPAAEAIRTTDTFAKGSTASAMIGGREVAIAGIVKGSGMIQPDMATLLAFIFTDAALPADLLQALVEEANEQAFRAITVDSDTSTSDMFLAFATARRQHPTPKDIDDPLLDAFKAGLLAVALDLAQQVVKDGEGASKFIKIRIDGAVDRGSARRIGLSIANSPLVKTAIAGEDANWGRIVMAIGKAYEPIELDHLAVNVGGHPVARHGTRISALDETPIAAHLAGTDILIDVTVGRGPGQATIWTSDLTHGYITINADYRS